MKQESNIEPVITNQPPAGGQSAQLLRQLADSDAQLTTPARVEQNLLAAFRAQQTPQQAASAAISIDAVSTKAATRWRAFWTQLNRSWHWQAGACAVALLLLVFTVATLGRIRQALFKPVSVATHQRPIMDADVPKFHQPTTSVTDAVATNQTAQRNTATLAPLNPKVEFAKQAKAESSVHKRSTPERLERILVESEIATDYFPLVDESMLPSPESLQVVRVGMPRATLARFGLPIADDRADLPITADLKIGSDGITRAIRFIQNDPQPAMTVYADQPYSNSNYKKVMQKVR